jgi:aspartyl-tRNA(Asn)/glutamyl-tRNA(Gln) amidotransferase subunit C
MVRIWPDALRLPAVPIDRDTVRKTALLARLEMTPEELALAESQLGAILDYVGQISALDVSKAEPLAHAGEFSNVFRPDERRPSLPAEAALQNAPERAGPYFVVPKVVE